MSTPGWTPVSRPAPASEWEPADRWHAAFRVLLLAALLVGATAGVAALHPGPASESALTSDLAAHRVTRIQYDPGSKDVRWLDGSWRWRATTLVSWETGSQPASGDPARAWLVRQIDNSGRWIPVDDRSRHNDSWFWPGRLAPGPVQVATGIAWVLTFLVMLGRRQHRYANRWAWFWLFTVGGAGAFLYLLLEPQPLWRPHAWSPRPGRRPVHGGTGFLYAIVLSIAVSMAGYAVTRL